MKVLVAIAEGTEEIEAVTVIDVLRRAMMDVCVCSVNSSLIVKCSRGVKIEADALISTVKHEQFDCIVCPGGMPGATHLAECHELTDMIKKQHQQQKLIGAICAAPTVVLEPLGILPDMSESITCHPAFADKIGDRYCQDRVVVYDNIVTSKGPGTAIEFALTLVEKLAGKEMRAFVQKPMITHL